MAIDYAGQIRAAQPAGPYQILGWSLGGLIAQAMATVLAEEDAEVALLVLLDSYPGDINKLFKIVNVDPADGDSGNKRRELDMALDEATAMGIDRQLQKNIRKVMRNSSQFAVEHVPRRFQGDALLFVATDARLAQLTPQYAVASWEPFIAGTIAPHQVSTNHYHMLQPATLSIVGRVLTERLRPPVEYGK